MNRRSFLLTVPAVAIAASASGKPNLRVLAIDGSVVTCNRPITYDDICGKGDNLARAMERFDKDIYKRSGMWDRMAWYEGQQRHIALFPNMISRYSKIVANA